MKIQRPKSKQVMPESAERVFQGKIFDVYQWEEKMYDGSTTTFEKVKRADTVITFPVLENGKILLAKQEQPGKEAFIGAVGGRMEEGEDVQVAAARELLEETGYEASEYVLWKSMQPISKVEWAVYVFVAKGLKKVSEQNLDAGERIELMEVTFDEFMEIVLRPDFSEQEIYRDVVEATLDEQKKAKLKNIFSL